VTAMRLGRATAEIPLVQCLRARAATVAIKSRAGLLCSQKAKRDNAALQLRRAISIQAGGKRLLEKHAIASSAASAC
jgi:hypothetical protein